MEEKTLIKSDQYNAKKILIVFLIIGAILFLFFFGNELSQQLNDRWMIERYEKAKEHQNAGTCGLKNGGICSSCEFVNKHPSRFLFELEGVLEYYYLEVFIPAGIVVLLGILVYFWLRSYELTVTNKRVFGRVAWGKRVDLPMDSISAIATVNLLKGISVSTSSGRISFLLVKNASEIYEVINNLLITRQREEAQKAATQSEKATGTADELKKYKDLLDTGVISQEEFDAKKKQLLGL